MLYAQSYDNKKNDKIIIIISISIIIIKFIINSFYKFVVNNFYLFCK